MYPVAITFRRGQTWREWLSGMVWFRRADLARRHALDRKIDTFDERADAFHRMLDRKLPPDTPDVPR